MWLKCIIKARAKSIELIGKCNGQNQWTQILALWEKINKTAKFPASLRKQK